MFALENVLYPPTPAYNTGHLDVGDGHKIYYEESGNPKGIPVVIFHGGPGYWSGPNHRRNCHPEKYRIILHHQRGCGLSKPLGSLDNNETHHLLSDVDKLLDHLKVDKALLVGGSWGSTMSLLYAQHAPERTLGMIIFGVFLGDQQWTNWYLEAGGAELFYPENYERLQEILKKKEGEKLAETVLNRTKNDPNSPAGKAIVDWESLLVQNGFSLFPGQRGERSPDYFNENERQKPEAMAGVIEMHYLARNCFIKDNQILNNMDKIKHLPGYIIQGRYDMVCPPKQAWLVHKAWPKSDLLMVPDAGHHSRELLPYLIKALDVFDIDKGFDILNRR